MSAARPVRVALVGAGHLGSFHLAKILANPAARLVAVVEPDADRRARAAATVAARLSPPLAAQVQVVPQLGALDRNVAEAAIVAAPTAAHAPLALACIARGWHLLVEKPLAATAAAAAELVAAAKAAGTLLQVGHLERYNPAVRTALPHLRHARFITTERLSPFRGRGADVDVVLDLMVHDLDLVAHAVGHEVVEVRAVGVAVLTGQVDMASARLTFANGAVAQLSAGRVSLAAARKLRFFTAERYVSVDCLTHEVKSVRRLPADDAGDWPHVAGEALAVTPADALAEQDAAFVAAVASGQAPWIDGEAGLRAVRLAEAVIAAFQPFGTGPDEAACGRRAPTSPAHAAQPSTAAASPATTHQWGPSARAQSGSGTPQLQSQPSPLP